MGSGFNLQLKLQTEDQVSIAQEYVRTQFPHAVENERFGQFICFHIMANDVQSLGRVYESLEGGAQSTLPLIFTFGLN